ncbi:MAG: hypothetical protein P4N41_18065 [Negativicutes bacterium]|nr:hypothetical protein [Negativicutes bacterium]
MSKGLPPGTPAPASGIYGVVGPHGGKTPFEVTSTKDKPLPPTQKPGQTYILDEKAKHKK